MFIDNLKGEIYDILVDFIPGSDDVANATNKIMALINNRIDNAEASQK